jgi:hypothetical protein
MPESVAYETITKPLKIRRYELNALFIQELLKEDILRVVDLNAEHKTLSKNLHEFANKCLYVGKRSLSVIHRAECDCLALVDQIGAQALAMDERTLRMLVEAPKKLAQLLQYRIGKPVKLEPQNYRKFKGLLPKLCIVRSVELAAFGFEEELCGYSTNHKIALEAVLFALKFHGCGVSMREIEQYLRDVDED